MAKPTIEQVSELHRQIESGRVTREAFQTFLRNPDQPLVVPGDPLFKVTVDYGLSLAEMIAAGKYDWVNPDITSEHFPISGEGKVERELVLVHLDRVATTDEAIAEIDRRDLRLAKIEDLLALGAKLPDIQRQFPVVELGSTFLDGHGRRDFAGLRRRGAERVLSLDWGVDDWLGDCRFLAARK